MIEAVNSVIANGPLLRGNAEQAASARSQSADLNQIDTVAQAPRAPFLSLITVIDENFDEAVFARRDSETGDILRQFPSEERLAQIERQAASQAARRQANAQFTESVGATNSSPAPSQGSGPSLASVDISVNTVDVDVAPQQSSSAPRAGEAQIAAAALANTAASAQPQIVSVSISA